MKIAVVGTGYVGLVTGTCLAESGNDVVCIDIDRAKIDMLKKGIIPIYEPGLSELVLRNQQGERLNFTTDMGEGVRGATLIFLAVGTPPAADGSADLSTMWAVVDQIAPHLSPEAVVIVKSTVPVGTNTKIHHRLQEKLGRVVDVASNPEFLKEGAAIDDFMKPDRVVVGTRRPEVTEVLRELYSAFLRTEKPFLSMSPESAEMSKYVANAILSTKISFINEIAGICEKLDADINDVRRGIGHDQRIGFAFMFPGVGYGGSCFPKDVRALAMLAQEQGVEPRILLSVDEVNQKQKLVIFDKIQKHFQGKLRGKTIAVWGLSFKPRTDDIREAPALTVIDKLLEQGVHIRVHDPVAMHNVQRVYGDKLVFAEQMYDAVQGADALAIMTEWKEFVHPDFAKIRVAMRSPVVFDGRNIYEPSHMRNSGFTYYSIGRAIVSPAT